MGFIILGVSEPQVSVLFSGETTQPGQTSMQLQAHPEAMEAVGNLPCKDHPDL